MGNNNNEKNDTSYTQVTIDNIKSCPFIFYRNIILYCADRHSITTRSGENKISLHTPDPRRT